MSDTTNGADPMREHLLERKAALMAELTDRQARLAEVLALLQKIDDGRSTVNRKRRTTTNSGTAPEPTADDMPKFLRPAVPLAPEPAPGEAAAQEATDGR